MNLSFFSFLKYGCVANNAEPGCIWQDFIVFSLLSTANRLYIFIRSSMTSGSIIEEGDFKALSIEKILLFIILIPMVEELAFRGFLFFLDKKYISLTFLSVLCILLSVIKTPSVKYSAIFLSTIIFLPLLFSDGFRMYSLEIIGRYRIQLIYITSIAFGLAHLTNYSSFYVGNIPTIIIKISYGLFFCYAAVKYNSIWFAWLFHAMSNAIPTLILYFFRMCIR